MVIQMQFAQTQIFFEYTNLEESVSKFVTVISYYIKANMNIYNLCFQNRFVFNIVSG